jgi:hypothetical protein
VHVAGTRVYTTNSSGPFYILNGTFVTFYGRYRRQSYCAKCNNLGCNVTTPAAYGGSTTTSRLVSSNQVAALKLSQTLNDACTGVCTDPSDVHNLVFPLQPRSQCEHAHGWLAVNDDYDEVCAVNEPCEELEVVQGCDGTKTSSVPGIYKPLSDLSDCSNSAVDKTRSVYAKDGGTKYLYYDDSRDKWVFNSFCSDLGVSQGSFWAGNEPYLNTDEDVSCWDGGYGGNKNYEWTPLQLKCNNKSGGSSNGKGLKSAAIAGAAAVGIGFGIALCWFLRRRGKRNSPPQPKGESTSNTSPQYPPGTTTETRTRLIVEEDGILINLITTTLVNREIPHRIPTFVPFHPTTRRSS